MSEPVTVIGPGTLVRGDIEGGEDLTVEGRVEGTIRLSGTIVIQPSGTVRADIRARCAVISGVLVGNLEAGESVRVTAEGRVTGDISAPRVSLAEGAAFRGAIHVGEFDPEPPAEPARVESRPSVPAASRPPAPIPKLRPIGRARAARRKQ